MTSEWCVSNRVKRAASRCLCIPEPLMSLGSPGGPDGGYRKSVVVQVVHL